MSMTWRRRIFAAPNPRRKKAFANACLRVLRSAPGNAVEGYRAIIQEAVVRAKHMGTTRTGSHFPISAMRVA